MAQTATSIHLDSEIKPQFDSICKQIGVSVNSAINIFARAVVREKGFPFPVTLTKSGSEKRSARAQLALFELQNASAKSGKEWSDEEIDQLIGEYRKAKKK